MTQIVRHRWKVAAGLIVCALVLGFLHESGIPASLNGSRTLAGESPPPGKPRTLDGASPSVSPIGGIEDPRRRSPALPASLVLRVVSERGGPVVEATIKAREVGSSVRIGSWRTNDQGMVEIPSPPGRDPFTIDVTHPEFLSGHWAVDPGASRNRTLVLQPLERIEGYVVDEQGQAIATGPFVLAYPEADVPSHGMVARAISGESVEGILACRADPSGRFELPHAKPNARYAVVAGGGGLASPTPVSLVAGTASASVIVRALFGMRIIFDGLPTGAELHWQSPGPQWTWDPKGSSTQGLPTSSIVALLAGLDQRETVHAPIHPQPLLFLGSASLDSVGPIHFTGTPAGCHSIDTLLWAPRVLEDVPSVLVPVTSFVSGWGSARIRLAGIHSPAPGVRRVTPMGKLYLLGEDPRCSFEVPFDAEDWNRGFLEIENIPEGRYSVSISTESGFAHYPVAPDSILVLHDEEAEFTCDLDLSCAVEVLLASPEGQEKYTGEATVEVHQLVDGRWYSSYPQFAAPPYLIQGLVPGTYRFKLFRPFFEPEPIEVVLDRQHRRDAVVFLPR